MSFAQVGVALGVCMGIQDPLSAEATEDLLSQIVAMVRVAAPHLCFFPRPRLTAFCLVMHRG